MISKKLDIKTKKLIESLLVGTYKTPFKWRGIEFLDYRVYGDSDDAKYIDFWASSRAGNLIMKQYVEERELHVYFLINLSKSMRFGSQNTTKLDTLKEIFFYLSYSAKQNNDKIWALVFDDEWYSIIPLYKPTKSIQDVEQILYHNSLPKIKNFHPKNVVQVFNSLPIKKSLVFLLSDNIEFIDSKDLKILCLKNDTICVNIFDEFENTLTQKPGTIKVQSGNGFWYLSFFSQKKIHQYREIRWEKLQHLAKKIYGYGGRYIQIDNQDEILKKLLIFFKHA